MANRPLKLRPFIIIIIVAAVTIRHLLITIPRFGHHRPEKRTANWGTPGPRLRALGPVGNLSLLLPRPAREPTQELGPGGRPGGGASPRDPPVSNARIDRGCAGDHPGAPKQANQIGRSRRVTARTVFPAPPIRIPASPPPHHPRDPSLPPPGSVRFAPFRQAPCES